MYLWLCCVLETDPHEAGSQTGGEPVNVASETTLHPHQTHFFSADELQLQCR